ncbi:hypothetical protein BGZ63DRAFT_383633 [Mariannaea sp. PMI_226]|nr:hypothetical protein BGZ63DRAFT_383633 [Mariannaea sp. PMI_226]
MDRDLRLRWWWLGWLGWGPPNVRGMLNSLGLAAFGRGELVVCSLFLCYFAFSLSLFLSFFFFSLSSHDMSRQMLEGALGSCFRIPAEQYQIIKGTLRAPFVAGVCSRAGEGGGGEGGNVKRHHKKINLGVRIIAI